MAEGVETEEQLAFLRAGGCDCIQGFCYARPMPEEEFAALLDEVQTEIDSSHCR